MNTGRDILQAMFAFLLPKHCLACNTEIETGFLCKNCHDYLPMAPSPRCTRCGRPVSTGNLCSFCLHGTNLDHGRTWLLFVPPVDIIIHAFKYRRMSKLSCLLGRAMATVVQSDRLLSKADMIVPVPLFWWKRLRRTYNQAELLARVIGEECHIPEARILKRIRFTRTQTRLDARARHKNVAGAFAPIADCMHNKNIILVDDVMTTGATMNECARVLKAGGARKVYSCVAAITPE